MATGEPTATEADRAAAHALWNEILCNGGVPGWTATGAIAAALAAERQRARAPFSKIALDVKDGWQPSADRLANAILAYTGGYPGKAEQ